MQQFLVLFREPDGRKDQHTPEAITLHRENWRNVNQGFTGRRPIVSWFLLEGKFSIPEGRNSWQEKMKIGGRLAGGMPLTLKGKVIKGKEQLISEGPHTVGDEIVGGYLLINATNLEEATTFIQSCPIFEFDGYAEVREIMSLPLAPTGNASPETAKSSLSSSLPDSSLQEKNKSIVRRFNTSFIQQGDISAFHEIISPEVINHTAPAGISNGADGMLTVIQLFRKALPDLEVKIIRQVAEDDIVVTHKTFHATHTGELMGIPPSGKPIVIPVIDIVRLRNGRYIEHWGIRDMSALR